MLHKYDQFPKRNQSEVSHMNPSTLRRKRPPNGIMVSRMTDSSSGPVPDVTSRRRQGLSRKCVLRKCATRAALRAAPTIIEFRSGISLVPSVNAAGAPLSWSIQHVAVALGPVAKIRLAQDVAFALTKTPSSKRQLCCFGQISPRIDRSCCASFSSIYVQRTNRQPADYGIG
jgi:hypothetical protein